MTPDERLSIHLADSFKRYTSYGWTLRRDGKAAEADAYDHLKQCPDATARDVTGEDGRCGEGTCEMVYVQCVITCPHGHAFDWEYSESGSWAELYEEMSKVEEPKPKPEPRQPVAAMKQVFVGEVATVDITPDISGFTAALQGVSAALAPFVIAELRVKLDAAEASIERVRELHARQAVHEAADRCLCPDRDEDTHPVDESDTGAYICERTPIGAVCTYCLMPDSETADSLDGAHVNWPCPTIAALDGDTPKDET